MALMQCTIHYDAKKKTTSVKWSNVPPKIKKGDKVEFVSDDPNTAIQFKHGSPFDSSAASQTFHVGTGAELTFEKPGKQHFDCGTWDGTGTSTPYPSGTVTGNP